MPASGQMICGPRPQLRGRAGSAAAPRAGSSPAPAPTPRSPRRIARLRDRSRDLVRNNPYAAKAVKALVSNMVGTGSCRGRDRGDAGAGRQADRLWAEFAAACDADGLTDFSGLQALIVRSLVESGECLVRHPRAAGRGRPAGAAAAAGARARSPRQREDRRSADGGFVVQGVEFDRARPPARLLALSRRIPARRRVPQGVAREPAGAGDRVLHLFDRLRPGQVRGVPWFAPVILKLRDLDEYDEAELVRKKIEACFAAFVTGADDEETLGTAATDADGSRIETFEPGMIEYLAARART